MYDACAGSVMLYGSEIWPITKKLEDLLLRGHCRMIQLSCGVRLRTRIPSKDLLFSSGLVDIRQVIKRNRLLMFGHVARRAENEQVGKILHLEAPSKRLPRRPKKTWSKNVEENMREANATREAALNRLSWRAITSRLDS